MVTPAGMSNVPPGRVDSTQSPQSASACFPVSEQDFQKYSETLTPMIEQSQKVLTIAERIRGGTGTPNSLDALDLLELQMATNRLAEAFEKSQSVLASICDTALHRTDGTPVGQGMNAQLQQYLPVRPPGRRI